MTNGQKAYEAYANHQANKTHDGSPLPGWDEVPEANQAAWEHFARGVERGLTAEIAYGGPYLDAVQGKTMSGGPAPAFAFFLYNRPDIAAAWKAAADAVK